MSVPISSERRLLTEAEFEAVKLTHYPDICGLGESELADAARRLRTFRDKSRDIARQQRREMRGKADARGARPARDNTGTSKKKTIFSGALRRVNRELKRARTQTGRAEQTEFAQRALELKRRNRAQYHPSAGRTARSGMHSIPNTGPTVQVDPREVGRVSQFMKAGQARRDSR